MKKQILIIVVLLVILSIALTACGSQPTAATPAPVANAVSSTAVVAEGRLEPVQGTNL
jgi:curli biogenesis system outer membrane secretion channel CsgG